MDFQPKINKILRNSIFAVAGIIIILSLLNYDIRLNEDEFKALAALSCAVLLSILMFFWGWELFGIKSMIENIPTSKIRSMPMGIVELKGDAQAKYPMETKLNHINCVFYKYKVEKRVVTGYGKTAAVLGK